MEYIIRKANIEDLPGIGEIYNQAISKKYQTGDTQPVQVADRIDWFKEHTFPDYPVYVIEYNKMICGWASISPYRKGRAALKKTVEISFYVHEQYFGKGFGSRLLEKIAEHSKEFGYKTIFAIVIEENQKSINLLKKYGFELWGRFPDVVETGDKIFSHCFYGKKI